MQISKVLTAICQQQLSKLRQQIPPIQGLLLATVDGFQIAFEWPDPQAGGRLSAMTASLHALSHTLAREAGAGVCQSIVLNGPHARVLVVEVPNLSQAALTKGRQNSPLLLTVVASLEADLTELAHAGQAIAQEIGQKFSLLHE